MREVSNVRRPLRGTRGITKSPKAPSKHQGHEDEVDFKEYKTEIYYDESKRTFTAYITDAITAPSDYTNVFNMFAQAKEDETIEVLFCTPGGRKDTLDLLRAAAERTEAFTKAILGDVASAGTIIPLAFDDLEALPNTEFMIHNYSGGAWGKHHELMAQADFMKREMPECFRRYYKDFLSPEELEYVIAGNDIYLNADEVNERWQNVMRVREAELDALLEADKEAQKAYYMDSLNKLGVYVKELPPIVSTLGEPTAPKAPSKKKPKYTKELKDI